MATTPRRTRTLSLEVLQAHPDLDAMVTVDQANLRRVMNREL